MTETVPDGFVPTTPTTSTFDLQSRIEFVWAQGEANLPANDPRIEEVVGDQLIFGNTVPGSIHGFKFEDLNGNGVYDPNTEPPLAGVQFALTGTGFTGSLTTTTGTDGRFWFTNLLPGTYTVTETVPTGFFPTTPITRTFDLQSRQEFVWARGEASLPPNDPRVEVLADSNGDGVGDQLIFGNTVPGSIHGFKFEDLNGNGVYDPNTEPPLASVTFTLSGIDVQGIAVHARQRHGRRWPLLVHRPAAGDLHGHRDGSHRLLPHHADHSHV